jgi:hypothetical protein
VLRASRRNTALPTAMATAYGGAGPGVAPAVADDAGHAATRLDAGHAADAPPWPAIADKCADESTSIVRRH